jgi:hypothetical protein
VHSRLRPALVAGEDPGVWALSAPGAKDLQLRGLLALVTAALAMLGGNGILLDHHVVRHVAGLEGYPQLEVNQTMQAPDRRPRDRPQLPT